MGCTPLFGVCEERLKGSELVDEVCPSSPTTIMEGKRAKSDMSSLIVTDSMSASSARSVGQNQGKCASG